MEQTTLLLTLLFTSAAVSQGRDMNVKKCCPYGQMMVERDDTSVRCEARNNSLWAPRLLAAQDRQIPFQPVEQTNEFGDKWTVLCTDDDDVDSRVCLNIISGTPDCGPVRAWPIYSYPGSADGLLLRPAGILRHTVLNDLGKVDLHYDYTLDQYCVDGIELLHGGARTPHGLPDPSKPTPEPVPFFYAILCEPGHGDSVDLFTVFVGIVYPIGLSFGILLLISLVAVHFVLKELRDLSGCMLISLAVAYLIHLSFKLVLVVADNKLRVSLLFLETCMHGADVAAHFWLNSIGHRAWLAVRHPRKEASRPEGRRFFLYSLYAWGSAFCAMGLAIMLRFLIISPGTSPHSPFTWYRIGWLGISIFCSTNAFLLLANLYFYITIRITMGKQTTYGRTFHRNKGFSHAFTRLFIVMETVWVFQSLALTEFTILLSLSMVADILLPMLLVWTSLKGRRVLHLLKIRFQTSQCWLCRKCFAAKEEQHAPYFGEEMMALGTPI